MYNQGHGRVILTAVKESIMYVQRISKTIDGLLLLYCCICLCPVANQHCVIVWAPALLECSYRVGV